MTTSVLLNIRIPTFDEYIALCRKNILVDLKTVLSEFEVDFDFESEYNDCHALLSHQIKERIDRNTDINQHNSIMKRQHILKQIEKLYESRLSNIMDPAHIEFWSSFIPVLEKMIDPNLILKIGNDRIKIFCDENRTLFNAIRFFNLVLEIFKDLVDESYQFERMTDSSSNEEFDMEKYRLRIYVIIEDFMNRYALMIVRLVIYTQSDVGCDTKYNAILCNYKRWAKIDNDFQKKINVASEYMMINGLNNILKRKENNNDDIGKIILSLVSDYANIHVLPPDSKENQPGNIGFLISTRLRMPSMIDVFRPYVNIENIIQVLDLSKFRDIKNLNIEKITTQKLTRLLKASF